MRLTQSSIEAHASRVDSQVSAFEVAVGLEIEQVVAIVTDHLLRTLEFESGSVVESRSNLLEIRNIEAAYSRALSIAGFYEETQSFVASLADQFDEFRDFYVEMRRGTDLPDLAFGQDDREILSIQAGSALAAIEAPALVVGQELRMLSSRLSGNLTTGELVQSVSETIRKISKVGPIARDQMMVFFRMVGRLVYGDVADSERYMFCLVGPVDDKMRPFCSSRIGKLSSWEALGFASNGQIPDVLVNGGGYGCRHWWEIVPQ